MNQFHDQMTYQFCMLTNDLEQYVCVNQLCSQETTNFYGCYKCLVKKHNQLKCLHFDQIIEINFFLTKIQKQQEEKKLIIEKLLKECDSKKKNLLQTIGNDENLLNKHELYQKIEQYFEVFLRKLEIEKSKLLDQIIYSSSQHCELLDLYNEKIEDYQNQINSKCLYQQENDKLILEKCQVISLYQFNMLQNEIYRLKSEFQKLAIKFDQQEIQLQRLITIEKSQEKIIQILSFIVCLILFIYVYKQQMQQNLENNQKFLKYSWITGEILENREVSEFKDFTLLYDRSFIKHFKNETYNKIINKVFEGNQDRLVCIGARVDLIIPLIGCDLASEILQQTNNAYSAHKSNNGDIFWYWVVSKSFGFSPNMQIALKNFDEEDPQSGLRLSYGTGINNMEDRRVGVHKGYENTKQFNLIIYYLEEQD